jgi:hypothetical protein
MIAPIKRRTTRISTPAWHAAFLAMVPRIRRQARISFRNARPELREELIHEVVTNCFAAYARLVELGKEELAFPTALARFAIGQVRVGRQVGNRLRIREVMSRYAQNKKGFQVERLDQFHAEDEEWREILIEDRRAGPAETAACRIDFASWLRRLPSRRRRIALALAGGETTTAAAKKFGVTAARVSQLRRWLKESWEAFQGEPELGAQLQPAAA